MYPDPHFSSHARTRGCRAPPGGVGGKAAAWPFTRYSFTSKLLCTSESSVSGPSPSEFPTLLQYCCTTIVQYATPPPRPPFVCHTPYAIGIGNVL